MAVVYTPGKTFTSTESVGASDFNQMVANMAIACAANTVLGRENTSGNITEITCTPFGRTVLAATTAQAVRGALLISGVDVTNSATCNLANQSSFYRSTDDQGNATSYVFTNTANVAGQVCVLRIASSNTNAYYNVATNTALGNIANGTSTMTTFIFVSDGVGGMWPLART